MEQIFIGVISDTHGEIAAAKRAVELFRQHKVKTVIHCGDIGGAAVVECFAGLDAHFVYGNTDGQSQSIAEAVKQIGGTLHGWHGEIECCGKRIFFLHGHHSVSFENAVHSKKYDLICYGHTHFAAFELHGGTLLLNPGAFSRTASATIAVVKLPEMEAETLTV
ncbi:MAG: YfcE family phosphodiesterase [Planctomycetaceae bacterium]|nr:YfcE family phosphodiesterase [Planctomycetaceae bacterium]